MMLRNFIFLFCFTAFPIQANQQCVEADLILLNGVIYTGLTVESFAGTIAIKGSHITYVGSNLSDQELECSKAKVVDLEGAYIYPGFTDAHGHLKGIGYRELTLNLQGLESLKQTLAVVKEYLANQDPGEWVVGRGWIDKVWPEKRFPTRWDLDKFSPANPVMLERADGHAVVVNSIALKLANITSATPNPQGGFIEKNSTGEPTGLLVDMADQPHVSIYPQVKQSQ